MRVPRWRRYALVSVGQYRATHLISAHFTERGATRALRALLEGPVPALRSRLAVEPTDWAPRTRRVMRVVQVLGESPVGVRVDAIAAVTAMSPQTITGVLLDLSRRGWVACFTPLPGGAPGLWRLLSNQEWMGNSTVKK